MSIGNLEAGTESVAGGTLLHAWLLDPKWDVTQLVRFLRGDAVPASFARRDPYEWIDDALANGGERADFERDLAHRLGHLLNQEPEINQFWPRSEEMLFNLLSVCASMHQPEELYAPLVRMMNRRKLEGEWEGLDLRGRLRAALASNQLNWDLGETWVGMTQGQVNFLPGNPFHGLDAIFLMPMRDDTPPLKAISIGLRFVLPLIESGQEDREKVFSGLVQRVARGYNAGPEMVGYLLWQAYAEAWPTWVRGVLASELGYGELERFVMEYDQDLQQFLRGTPDPSKWELLNYAIKITAGIQVGLQKKNRSAAARFAIMRSRELRTANLGVPEELSA